MTVWGYDSVGSSRYGIMTVWGYDDMESDYGGMGVNNNDVIEYEMYGR